MFTLFANALRFLFNSMPIACNYTHSMNDQDLFLKKENKGEKKNKKKTKTKNRRKKPEKNAR